MMWIGVRPTSLPPLRLRLNPSRLPTPNRTDNQVKNRFNSTLRRLHGHLRRDATPASPVAGKKRKARTQASAVFAKMQARPAGGSPASGDSAGTVHATFPAESDDESDAIAGLEQLVQASLEVQRAESGGEEEGEEAAAAAFGSAPGDSETGDGSVRGARAYASDVREQMALAAGIQSQQAMYQAQLRHQLTMAQMASYAGSAATHPAAAAAAAAAPSFHAPRVETNAAAANGNAHALLHAQLVAAMQNPATVGALYQRLLMEQMMGMGAASAAAPAEATARPASSDASEASATATIPAWFGAFGGMDPATAARAMTIATGGIPTAL